MRETEEESEREREGERKMGEKEGVEGDVVGLDGCLVPAIPVSADARLVAALY